MLLLRIGLGLGLGSDKTKRVMPMVSNRRSGPARERIEKVT